MQLFKRSINQREKVIWLLLHCGFVYRIETDNCNVSVLKKLIDFRKCESWRKLLNHSALKMFRILFNKVSMMWKQKNKRQNEKICVAMQLQIETKRWSKPQLKNVSGLNNLFCFVSIENERWWSWNKRSEKTKDKRKIN